MKKPSAIGILSEGTATTSFIPVLREKFSAHALVEISAADLKDEKLMRGLGLLVLPGVFSEDSPYPRFFTPEAVDALRAGFDSGLCVWGSCAPVYQFAAAKSYASPHKTVLKAPGLGLLAGEAWGPVDGQNPVIDSRNRFSDTRIVQVAFNDRAGRAVTAGVPYANGPAYVRAANDGVDVIARYVGVPGFPVAAGSRDIGNGCLFFEGVLPEMRLSQITIDKEEDRMFPGLARLRDSLRPHDAGREELLDTITGRIAARMKMNP